LGWCIGVLFNTNQKLMLQTQHLVYPYSVVRAVAR
jgi:hypothetical protein